MTLPTTTAGTARQRQARGVYREQSEAHTTCTSPSRQQPGDDCCDNEDHGKHDKHGCETTSRRKVSKFEKLILTGTFFSELLEEMYGVPFHFRVPMMRRSTFAVVCMTLWAVFAWWLVLISWIESTNKAPLTSFFCGFSWLLHTVFVTISLVGHFFPPFQFWFHYWFAPMAAGLASIAAITPLIEQRTPSHMYASTNFVLRHSLPERFFSWGWTILGGPFIAMQLFFWIDLETHSMNLYETGNYYNIVDRTSHWLYMLCSALLPTAFWFLFLQPHVVLMTDFDIWPSPTQLALALVLANGPWMMIAMRMSFHWIGWPLYLHGGRGWLIQSSRQTETSSSKSPKSQKRSSDAPCGVPTKSPQMPTSPLPSDLD